jgi:high-affinity K+ transport system ATPase subunit B
MTQDLIDRSRQRHTLTDLALVVLIVALVVALLVAAVVVSIGMARADTLGQIAGHGGGKLAVAALVALVIADIGGLTAAMLREVPQRHD